LNFEQVFDAFHPMAASQLLAVLMRGFIYDPLITFQSHDSAIPIARMAIKKDLRSIDAPFSLITIVNHRSIFPWGNKID